MCLLIVKSTSYQHADHSSRKIFSLGSDRKLPGGALFTLCKSDAVLSSTMAREVSGAALSLARPGSCGHCCGSMQTLSKSHRMTSTQETRLCYQDGVLRSHWLILFCALAGNRIYNLDVLGEHFNQLSYPATLHYQM